jgi:large conductance mechanosensitive channel
MLSEFKTFIMRGNVVDLAVGIVIGAAFTAIVNSMVKDIFMPIIGLITGGFDVSRESIDYKDAKIGWGQFVQSIISFVIIGFCMFLVVKGMNKMKDKGWMDKPAPAEPTSTEKLLAEIRDLLKQQTGSPPPPPAPANAP